MWYLLNAYWIPLLLAGLLGVIVGWMSCNNQTIAHNARPSWFSGWVPWGIAAAALAAFAALQMLMPGKQGLLLDTALMLFGSYMLGCCIGCMLRPKPAARLATAGAVKSGTSGSSTSGKVATAAAVGTAASAAGLAAAKAATAKSTGTTSSTTSGSTSLAAAKVTTTAKPVTTTTETTKISAVTNLTSTGSSATSGTNGTASTVATALGAAATGVAATAAAAGTKGAAAVATAATTASTSTSGGKTASDGDIKVFTGAAKFGERPVLYNAPRGGKGDELSLIWGVAEKLEHKMNAAGIWHFDQIANWTVANVEWFEHEFEGFKGRLDRDKWIEQCKKLAAGWRPDGHVGQRPKG
jgi:predicted flap endonuclease-1-like 5' DNA nuclease